MYKIFKMILSDKTGKSNILFPFRGGGHNFSAHATPAPRTIPNAPPYLARQTYGLPLHHRSAANAQEVIQKANYDSDLKFYTDGKVCNIDRCAKLYPAPVCA